MRVLRRTRTWIVVGLVVVALAALVLAALPPLARQVVVARLRANTDREVSIADLRLNLFTRRLSVVGLRVADRSGPSPLAAFERLDVEFHLLPLLRGRLHLDTVALRRPELRIARTGPGELNVSDIVARFMSGPPSARKEPADIAVGRFTLTDGVAVFDDQAMSPARKWEISGLRADVRDLATLGPSTGRATVAFELADAPFELTLDEIRLRPVHARAVVGVRGLDLTPFWGYVRTPTPITPERGRFETRLTVDYDAVNGIRAGGEVTIRELALIRRGESTPFVSTPTLAMTSRDIVYRDGALTAGRLEVTGAPTIVDASVSPPRSLPLRSLRLSIEDFAWPPRGTARAELAAELPEAGTLAVRGTADLASQAVDVGVEARDVALAAYRRFLPIDVPVSGRAEASLRLRAVVAELPRVAVFSVRPATPIRAGPAFPAWDIRSRARSRRDGSRFRGPARTPPS